jgi:hypothetical protein
MKCKAIFMLVLAAIFLPGHALADGCQFLDASSVSLEVRATAQRAVLWQRGGVWEVHITPIFERSKAKAAWVVPFPVLPTVKESSADFFNQLEILTAPMFIEACVPSGGCEAGGGGDGSGGSAGRGQVDIWEQGTVGELDYVILTAQHQVYIVNWLKANNYHVTALAETSLKKFEAQGTFFFAAKISETADPAKPVTPVRFILPELREPKYPLVLTGLGVPEGASLELSIWVISPANSYYVPTSHRYGTLEQGITTSDEYTAALARFYRTHRPGTLVMLSSGNIANNPRVNRQACVNSKCIPFSMMGISAPQSWCAEIGEIVANKSVLFRYQGRLGPTSLSEDLVFGPLAVGSTPTWVDNTYLDNTCAPEEEEEGTGPCGSSN